MVNGLPDAADPEAEAEAAAAARRKKRFRNLSILAGGVAVVLCSLILMIVLNHPKKTPQVRAPETIKGTVSDVFVMSKEFGVAPSDGGAVKRIIVKDQDIIYVNGERHLLEELERGDVVEITRTVDPAVAQSRSGDPCHAAREVCHRETAIPRRCGANHRHGNGRRDESPGPEDLRPGGI